MRPGAWGDGMQNSSALTPGPSPPQKGYRKEDFLGP